MRFIWTKVQVAIIEEEYADRKAEGKIIDIIEHQITTVCWNISTEWKLWFL